MKTNEQLINWIGMTEKMNKKSNKKVEKVFWFAIESILSSFELLYRLSIEWKILREGKKFIDFILKYTFFLFYFHSFVVTQRHAVLNLTVWTTLMKNNRNANDLLTVHRYSNKYL